MMIGGRLIYEVKYIVSYFTMNFYCILPVSGPGLRDEKSGRAGHDRSIRSASLLPHFAEHACRHEQARQAARQQQPPGAWILV